MRASGAPRPGSIIGQSMSLAGPVAHLSALWATTGKIQMSKDPCLTAVGALEMARQALGD